MQNVERTEDIKQSLSQFKGVPECECMFFNSSALNDSPSYDKLQWTHFAVLFLATAGLLAVSEQCIHYHRNTELLFLFVLK